MEPPSIPDHRPHRAQAMAHTIDDIDAPVFRSSAQDLVRSSSPAGQVSRPQAFGQPAIGRPPLAARQPSAQSRPSSRLQGPANGFHNGHNGYGDSNGEQSGRKYSIDGDSVAESVATQDLGHHSIGQPQPPPRSEKRSSVSSNNFDQRSVSDLSLDQRSLGHHSIGGPSGGYYS